MPHGDTWSEYKVTDLYQLSVCLINLLMQLSTWDLSSGVRPMTNINAQVQTIVLSLRGARSQNHPSCSRKKHSTLDIGHGGGVGGWGGQAVSRPVMKIWNLKGTYKPADLKCSAGDVYNCMSSWTTLHILLVLLPLKTPPPTLFKQQTLSNGKLTDGDHTGCSIFVYLFNL